uniref:G-protein coupled receptors family 1 profile domain-containing protein n=1 Tax=Romanomermis culicivorax TaxID=13658 RepID=A0A915IQU7_ROMCU
MAGLGTSGLAKRSILQPVPFGVRLSAKEMDFVCGCFIIPIAVFGIFANLISMFIYTSRIQSSLKINFLWGQEEKQEYKWQSNLPAKRRLDGAFASAWVTRIEQPPMNNFINVLFTGLATFDVVLLLAGTPIFSLMPIANYLKPCYDSELLLTIMALFVTAFYPLAMVAQSCSVWTTIFISFERFVAVCLPFRAKSFNSVNKAKFFLALILLSSLLYNVARFFEYNSNVNDVDFNLHNGCVHSLNFSFCEFFISLCLRSCTGHQCCNASACMPSATLLQFVKDS